MEFYFWLGIAVMGGSAVFGIIASIIALILGKKLKKKLISEYGELEG